MMAGRPVIYLGAPDGQAAVDIRMSAAGEVVDAGDATGLVAALRKMTSPDLRAVTGAAGRAHYEREHTVEMGTKRWTAVLAALPPAGPAVPRPATSGPATSFLPWRRKEVV